VEQRSTCRGKAQRSWALVVSVEGFSGPESRGEFHGVRRLSVHVQARRRQEQRTRSVMIAFPFVLSVVQWSEFLATDPEVWVRFPALPDSPRSIGSGTGCTQPRGYK
jgi:hypothetical protein